jgi:hypothetical protein
MGEKERATGFEPATSSLGSWHSTTELRPRTICLIIAEEGFFAICKGSGGDAFQRTTVSREDRKLFHINDMRRFNASLWR